MSNEIAPRNEDRNLRRVRLCIAFVACVMMTLVWSLQPSLDFEIKFDMDFEFDWYWLTKTPEVRITEDTAIAGAGGGGITEIRIPSIKYSADMFGTEKIDEEIIEAETIDIKVMAKTISYDMDISQPSGLSKEDFVWAMQNCQYDRNGVLGDCAEAIWEECQKRGLNEFAICGIVAGESLWCDSELAWSRKNVMSIRKYNGDYKYYNTYKECILDGIRLIDEEYISEEGKYYRGVRLSDVAKIYAESPTWATHVSECAEMCTRALQEKEA